MTIRELMDGIRKLDMVLPEFQREYVWEREQAKQLMVSLFRSYPTGSLLFWQTDNPPEIKNAALTRDKIGTTLVILDGQQRLTTLYLLTRGEIPPYYTENDLKTDPRTLYPSLWKLERYEDFLVARRKLIATAINEQMLELLRESEPAKPQTLDEMLQAGESAVLEFKSTLRWDINKQQANTELQKVIAKTVAGLMNAEGGTLVIGIADDGTVLGLENDFKSLKRPDKDGFEQVLRQVLIDFLGAEFSQYVHVSFPEHEGRSVCVIKIDRTPRPVYLTDKGSTDFYIRAGNTTRPLDVQATHEYISMHWET